MEKSDLIEKHAIWEDVTGIFLGALVLLSPFFSPETVSPPATLNAILAGIVIFALAVMEIAKQNRWKEFLTLFAGLWVMYAPIAFNYATGGALSVWHYILGAVVALVAALELWQSRTLAS